MPLPLPSSMPSLIATHQLPLSPQLLPLSLGFSPINTWLGQETEFCMAPSTFLSVLGTPVTSGQHHPVACLSGGIPTAALRWDFCPYLPDPHPAGQL